MGFNSVANYMGGRISEPARYQHSAINWNQPTSYNKNAMEDKSRIWRYYSFITGTPMTKLRTTEVGATIVSKIEIGNTVARPYRWRKPTHAVQENKLCPTHK